MSLTVANSLLKLTDGAAQITLRPSKSIKSLDDMYNDSRNIPEDVRSSIAAELARFYAELPATGKAQPRFSLSRALGQMCSERGLADGYEKEISGGLATMLGQSHDPHRAMIPFSVLRRDLTAGVTSAGGFLVGTQNAPLVELLRPWSVAVSAGATVYENLVGSVSVPRITTKPTGTWLTTEASPSTESQPVFGQLALVPKNASCYMEFSRLLHLQGDAAELAIGNALGVAVGNLIDQAVFSGSGAAGQPTGILNTSGINSIAGTALTWANTVALRKAPMLAGAQQSRLAWVGSPAVEELLSTRERFAGAGAIWGDAGIGGRPSFSTSNCPSGALIVADWSRLALALWGGMQIEINPFAGFTTGLWAARLIVTMDVGLLQPGAFSCATAVT